MTLRVRICRTGAGFALIAATLLSAACGGSDDERDSGSARETTASGTTVVFHLTGMLLVVPPQQPGGEVNVFLPSTLTDHEARLGFGMEAEDTIAQVLCVDTMTVRSHAICHVNLREWRLEPFGAGGEAAPKDAELPAGVLNVTHLSGTQHKVPVSPSDVRVTFEAGWAGPNQCSLANWTYQPVNQQGTLQDSQRAALVNVLDWEIHNPPNFELRFENRQSGRRIAVPLQPSLNKRTELFLAYIHTDDLPDLPRGRDGQGGKAGPLCRLLRIADASGPEATESPHPPTSWADYDEAVPDPRYQTTG